MTLRARRIIYIIFIAVFSLITPLIILYATGYRYNFQKHKLQKTGILMIKSDPTGAKIYLNGNLQKSSTPARLANLIPEDYSIKIEKDDFYPWQKILPVGSNLSTFAENITLFKKTLPTQTVSGDISWLSLSPDYGKLAYIAAGEEGSEAWLFDLKTSKKNILYQASAGENFHESSLQWSRDGQKIMITIAEKNDKIKYVVFDNRSQAADTYNDLNEFYFDFNGIKNTSLGLTVSEDMVFLPGPSNLLAVLNRQIQDLKIWNTGSGDLIFETEADSASWLPNGDKLLYTKNFEIWFYDVAAEQEVLVTRYSKEIRNASWINDNYILAVFDNTIRTIELDGRDQRNVADLLKIDYVGEFGVNPKGKKIYFIGSLGNQKGVFELLY